MLVFFTFKYLRIICYQRVLEFVAWESLWRMKSQNIQKCRSLTLLCPCSHHGCYTPKRVQCTILISGLPMHSINHSSIPCFCHLSHLKALFGYHLHNICPNLLWTLLPSFSLWTTTFLFKPLKLEYKYFISLQKCALEWVLFVRHLCW